MLVANGRGTRGVIVEGGINAYADGENVVTPRTIMRIANNDELRVIAAHKIAHNAMGHIEAKRRNAGWVALLGVLADVAVAIAGVNTGAQSSPGSGSPEDPVLLPRRFDRGPCCRP